MPRSLAAAANGASFLIGEAGMATARSEILGILVRMFVVAANLAFSCRLVAL